VKLALRSRWLRRHRFGADVLLASTLLLLALGSVTSDAPLEDRYRSPNTLAALFAVLQTAPLAVRRRAPVAVLAATSAGLAASGALGFPPTAGVVGPLIAVYTVASVYPRPRIAQRAIVASVLAVLASPFVYEGRLRPAEFAFALGLFGVPWFVGSRLYRGRARTAALEERAVRAEREREQVAASAVAEERARIARELHDVVAHAISVVVVQAGAARRVLHRDPERADESIAAVETVGRQALAEMRRLLEVLRREGEPDVLGPQPRMAQLDALVRQIREAGLPVELSVEGEPRPLPASIDLSAYRIVQEALTNTLKHAGPARAHVLVCYRPEELEITVRDDGARQAHASDNGTGSGHGLLGMRERVTLLGGSFFAGPQTAGGFEVRVGLPLDEVAR
jgi:signal transduction histidine kinase